MQNDPNYPKAVAWLEREVYLTASGKVYHTRHRKVVARQRKDGSLAFACKLPKPGGGQQDVSLDVEEETGRPITTWAQAVKEFGRLSNKKEHERLLRVNTTLGELGKKAIKGFAPSPQSEEKYLEWFAWSSDLHNEPVRKITAADLQDKLVLKMRTGKQRRKDGPLVPLAATTQRSIIGLHRRVFDRAIRPAPGLRFDNPVNDLQDLPPKKKARKHLLLSGRDSQRCLTVTSPAGPKYVNLVAVLDKIGLRMSEALGLRVGSIQGLPWNADLTAEEMSKLNVTIKIDMQLKQEKGQPAELTPKLKSPASYRTLPCPVSLIPFLLDQHRQVIAWHGSVVPIDLDRERFFPGLKHKGTEDYLRGLGHRLGLTKHDDPARIALHAHTFRHNWIVRLIKASVDPELGLDIPEIARQAGHTEETLVKEYLDLFKEIKAGRGSAIAIDRVAAEAVGG